jgi:metal-responsive CopG/Arc/MetJ family transcriptional regulator
MAKVLVSFDDKLLRRIDRAATASGKSRSAYLSDLAESEAARETGPGRTPSARAALRRLDRLFGDSPAEDSTEAIRAERDAR